MSKNFIISKGKPGKGTRTYVSPLVQELIDTVNKLKIGERVEVPISKLTKKEVYSVVNRIRFQDKKDELDTYYSIEQVKLADKIVKYIVYRVA